MVAMDLMVNDFYFRPGAAPTLSAVLSPSILRIVLASRCSWRTSPKSQVIDLALKSQREIGRSYPAATNRTLLCWAPSDIRPPGSQGHLRPQGPRRNAKNVTAITAIGREPI